jgi:hypothetical protein
MRLGHWAQAETNIWNKVTAVSQKLDTREIFLFSANFDGRITALG